MKYDAVIIGGGPGGYKSAEKLADRGRKVCLIEADSKNLGGTCLNEGCIPVKALLEASNLFSKIKRAGDFGIKASVDAVNNEEIRNNIADKVNKLKKQLEIMLKGKGIEIVYGRASFSSKGIAVINSGGSKGEYEAENYIIAAGSVPVEINGMESDGKFILNSSQIARDFRYAKRALIIGGGYIGCEFASLYNNLGSDVTVVEAESGLLPAADPDISRTLMREYKKTGIKTLTDSLVTSVNINNKEISAVIRNKSNEEEIRRNFDMVITAVGRRPNTENLGLENTGVSTADGFIETDDNMRTAIDNIFAVGDVINTPMLAHAAYMEAEAAVNAICGENKKVCGTIPGVIFTFPQIAFAGISETEAQKKGLEVNVVKKYFKSNPKASLMGDDSGFVKMIIKPETNEILGASIIGPQATELIHIILPFIENKMTMNELSCIVFGHPTLSEIFK